MAGYVVMEPPGLKDRADEDAVFVRDGFAWVGFFLPFLWLLWHRLWLEAVIVLALAVGLGFLSNFGAFILAAPLLSLLVSLYVGLEGGAMRLAALGRRGWRQTAVIEADSRSDAELRYLYDGPVGETGGGTRSEPSAPSRLPQRSTGPALGLLGYSGNSR